MGFMCAEVASAESRAATAEARVKRQQNQIKGMQWQLRCLHQAITKNKGKKQEAAGSCKCHCSS
jgi:hypothetical protein